MIFLLETVDLASKLPNSHTVGSVLKFFFQQLPEPLVPSGYCQPMIKVYGLYMYRNIDF